LPFEKTLTTRGYWKRTEKEVNQQANRVFGMEAPDQARRQTRFATHRSKDMQSKREKAPPHHLKEWGTFLDPTETWPLDKHFRIQFSNRMGFSCSHPIQDVTEWIEQSTIGQCDIRAAVELNITRRTTKGLQAAAKDIDPRGKLHLNHPLDPTRDLAHRRHLKGGSICWTPAHTNARTHSYHRDRHGRWIALRLTTKTTELAIYFAYRVCASTICGDTTTIAAREQNSLLQKNHPQALQVREAFLSDLGKDLQKERDKGREILILADANSPATHPALCQFMKRYDMRDLIATGAPPTCTKSNEKSRPTEIVFGTQLFEQAFQGLGFYPFFHFNGSDHRELEIVFDRTLLFQGGTPNTWHKRTINPKNPKHTRKFNSILEGLHEKSKTMDALEAAEQDLKSDDPATVEKGRIKACNIAH
jgi:hypothetical protein